MGVITEEFLNFKNASPLFSKIKRKLKSFGAVGLIDENNFPEYVSDVLNILGVSSFKESEAILKVKDKKVCLPKDFKELYAAYKCTDNNSNVDQRYLQNVSVFEYDITTEIFEKGGKCDIKCDYDKNLVERVTLKQFVNDRYITKCYSNPILLKLSPNVKPKCSEDCLNLISTSTYEISINDNTIFTNFEDGAILLQYFAFPLDDEGLPQIPDIIEIEKAVENYILWQIFQDFYLTDDIPNAAQKMQYLEMQYNRSLAEAKYILKLPRFSQLVNYTRRARSVNDVSFFSQMDRKRL